MFSPIDRMATLGNCTLRTAHIVIFARYLSLKELFHSYASIYARIRACGEIRMFASNARSLISCCSCCIISWETKYHRRFITVFSGNLKRSFISAWLHINDIKIAYSCIKRLYVSAVRIIPNRDKITYGHIFVRKTYKTRRKKSRNYRN